jgi:hypothetical protein
LTLVGKSLTSLFSRKPKYQRAEQRHACQIAGTLVMVDRLVSFEGRLIDFSSGGAMFRPRLVYLVDRRDVPVKLTIGDLSIAGRIVNTQPRGFGVRFDAPLNAIQMNELLGRDTAPNLPHPAPPAAQRDEITSL